MTSSITHVWCGACGIRFDIALAPAWVERIGRCGECGERALLVLGSGAPASPSPVDPLSLPSDSDTS